MPVYQDYIQADIQPSYTDSLMHHGIKGMHWGVRRFQNSDGSLTSAGKRKYKNQQSNGNKKPKRKKWTKAQKQLAKNVALGLGTAAAYGATAYAINKHFKNQNDDFRKTASRARKAYQDDFRKRARDAEQKAEQARRREEDAYRRASENYRKAKEDYDKTQNRSSNGSKYSGPKTATGHTGDKKTSDYEREARKSNVSYADAKKYADKMKDRVAKAQRDGTLTPEMVDELKRANAARRQAQARENAEAGVNKATSKKRQSSRRSNSNGSRSTRSTSKQTNKNRSNVVVTRRAS